MPSSPKESISPCYHEVTECVPPTLGNNYFKGPATFEIQYSLEDSRFQEKFSREIASFGVGNIAFAGRIP